MSIIQLEIPEDCENPADDMGSMQIHLSRALSDSEYEAFEAIAINSSSAGADYECDENALEIDGKLADMAWINCDKELLDPIRAFLNALN